MPQRKRSIPQKKRRFTVPSEEEEYHLRERGDLKFPQRKRRIHTMYPQRKRDITIPSEEEENPHNVTLRGRGVSLRERGVLKFPQRERGIETM